MTLGAALSLKSVEYREAQAGRAPPYGPAVTKALVKFGSVEGEDCKAGLAVAAPRGGAQTQ